MKNVLTLIAILGVPFISFGQFDTYQKFDNLFKKYKSPIIDVNVYNRLKDDDAIIYVGCYFTTDTGGLVKTQNFIPFIDVGNSYLATDSIWQSVITSLSKAASAWLFKPILWDFKNDKKSELEMNSNPYQRPFTGRPNYFLIFEMSGIQGSVIHKISLIKDFKIDK